MNDNGLRSFWMECLFRKAGDQTLGQFVDIYSVDVAAVAFTEISVEFFNDVFEVVVGVVGFLLDVVGVHLFFVFDEHVVLEGLVRL